MTRACKAIIEWASQFIDTDSINTLESLEEKLSNHLQNRFKDGHLVLDLEMLEEIIQKEIKAAAATGFNHGMDLGQKL